MLNLMLSNVPTLHRQNGWHIYCFNGVLSKWEYWHLVVLKPT